MPIAGGDSKEYKVGVKFGLDNKEFTSKLSGMQGMLKGFAATVVAAFTVTKIVGFIKEVTAQAMAQERAIVELNASMRAMGDYSEEASQAIQNYANELQRTIGIEDDVVLSNMAMVKALGHLSNEQLPKAEIAVIGLSEMLRISLDSAARMVGKTLNGTINVLARSGIQIDMTADKEGRLNQIIEASAAGWQIAKEKADTFQGGMIKLTNAWNDFLKMVGNFITSSPTLKYWLSEITDSINGLTDNVNNSTTAMYEFEESLNTILRIGLNVKAFFQGMYGVTKLLAVGFGEVLYAVAELQYYFGHQKWAFTDIYILGEANAKRTKQFLTDAAGVLDKLKESERDVAIAVGDTIEQIEKVADPVEKQNRLWEYYNKLLSSTPYDAVTTGINKIKTSMDDTAESTGNATEKVYELSKAFKTLLKILKDIKDAFASGDIAKLYGWSTSDMEPAERVYSTTFAPGANYGEYGSETQASRYGSDVESKRRKKKAMSFGGGDLAEYGDYAETFFKNIGQIFLDSAYDLGKELGRTGKIGNVISEVFNQLGDYIGQQVSEAISKSWNVGGGFFGPLIGGFFGGIISAFGGGGGGRGSSPTNVVYTFVTNLDQFYRLGTSMPSSYVMSGRGDRFSVDAHARTLDFAFTGYRNGAQFDY
jgi:hypothetical protein